MSKVTKIHPRLWHLAFIFAVGMLPVIFMLYSLNMATEKSMFGFNLTVASVFTLIYVYMGYRFHKFKQKYVFPINVKSKEELSQIKRDLKGPLSQNVLFLVAISSVAVIGALVQ